MGYSYFWGDPYKYIEELNVSYHPCYPHRPWFLDSNDEDLRTNLNDTICRALKLSRQDYEEAINVLNGKLNGTNIFFKTYEEAEDAKEWILSMITMAKLNERTPSI